MSLLAIDAMGGDNAPRAIIDGLEIFRKRNPSCSFIIYGHEAALAPLLSSYPALSACSTVVHTEENITDDMDALQTARNGKKSSMALAIEAVASGEADGLISAGNTAAYITLCSMSFRPLDGIQRPAIVSFIPTQKGESIMLDLGGNVKITAKNLLDYAIMADVFAKNVLGLKNPTVGLLNIGKEKNKGTDVLREAYALLEQNTSLHFQGFIEGDDIPRGTVNIIVTDGFTGNVALKTGEGVMHFFSSILKKKLLGSLRGKMAAFLARPLLEEVKEHFDHRRYNGALWLGFRGIAVKSHGGTDALGFAHAVEIAYDMVQAKITDILEKHLHLLQEDFAQKIAD